MAFSGLNLGPPVDPSIHSSPSDMCSVMSVQLPIQPGIITQPKLLNRFHMPPDHSEVSSTSCHPSVLNLDLHTLINLILLIQPEWFACP